MKVAQLMTRGVKTCSSDDSLHHAARLMWENDIGCVPIVDHAGRPVGMITDRDICMGAFSTGQSLDSITVSETMSKGTVWCDAEDSVSTAEERMRQAQVRRLPVVREGRLAGVLSLNDIALGWKHPPGRRRDGLRSKEVAKTLASICEHHVSTEAGSRAAVA